MNSNKLQQTVTIKGTTVPAVRQYVNPKFYDKVIDISNDVYTITKETYPDVYYTDYKHYSNKVTQKIMFSQPKGLIIDITKTYDWETLTKQAVTLGIPVKLLFKAEELTVKPIVARHTYKDSFNNTFKQLEYPFTKTTADVFTETQAEYTYSVTGQKITRPTDTKELARLAKVKSDLESLRVQTLNQLWKDFNQAIEKTVVWKAEMYNDFLVQEDITLTKATIDSYSKTSKFYKKNLQNISFDQMIDEITLYGQAYDIPTPSWFKESDINSYNVAKGYKEYSIKNGFTYSEIGKDKAYLNYEKRNLINHQAIVDAYMYLKTLEAKLLLADGYKCCTHCGKPHKEIDLYCTHCGELTIDLKEVREDLLQHVYDTAMLDKDAKTKRILRMSDEELLQYYTIANGMNNNRLDVNPDWIGR